MNRPNFFSNNETLTYLINMKYDNNHPWVDISVDFIDVPIWNVFSADDENWKMNIYPRGEIFSRDENEAISKSTLIVNKETGESNKEGINGSNPLLLGCRNLSFYAQENNWDSKFGGLDPEKAGILLSVEDGKLTYKVVSGKERPDMMCDTISGTRTLCRPYMDEIMEAHFLEMLPFEEKLEAAKDGDEKAMEAVALAYLDGDDIDEDPEQAVYWFTKLAELDCADAQFYLGALCAKGYGIQRDFQKAAYWMQRSAENGNDEAPAELKLYAKAAEAVKKIDSGDAQAQADLSCVLMDVANWFPQAGTEDDEYEQAFELAQKSAAQNNGDGLWALALAYQHGRGTEPNVEKAIECYQKAAEIGHASSQYSLACYYFRGDVLERDYKKGFELCLKSAEQGYGLAMADVGRCYQYGYGVMYNIKTAIEWYEKALEVIDNSELERTVKMLKENMENAMEDEDDSDDDDFDVDDSKLPSGYMEALEAFEEAVEYENQLADEGIISDAPRPQNGVMNLSPEGFPRIALKAQEGDDRAIAVLEKIKAANEM